MRRLQASESSPEFDGRTEAVVGHQPPLIYLSMNKRRPSINVEKLPGPQAKMLLDLREYRSRGRPSPRSIGNWPSYDAQAAHQLQRKGLVVRSLVSVELTVMGRRVAARLAHPKEGS